MLALVFDIDAEITRPFFHGGLDGTGGNHGAHFVASDGFPADGIEDIDLQDAPDDGGLPENGLEDAACGGWGDDVIRDAFLLLICCRILLVDIDQASRWGCRERP